MSFLDRELHPKRFVADLRLRRSLLRWSVWLVLAEFYLTFCPDWAQGQHAGFSLAFLLLWFQIWLTWTVWRVLWRLIVWPVIKWTFIILGIFKAIDIIDRH